jgi:TPR repeat protein
LTSLKVNIPTGSAGRYELVVTLLSIDGTQLAEARSALIIEDAAIFTSQPGNTEPQHSISAPAPLPANRSGRVGKAAQPPHDPAEDARGRRAALAAQGARYVAQGEQFLSEGNMAVARQFFQRAADAEYAPGAMRLAETYDPTELARLHAQGIAGDKDEARKWYERARQLGAAGADARLERLNQN